MYPELIDEIEMAMNHVNRWPNAKSQRQVKELDKNNKFLIFFDLDKIQLFFSIPSLCSLGKSIDVELW